ncbi:MAG: hypothetical protein AAFN11_22715 [Chloroflexota bacterium]
MGYETALAFLERIEREESLRTQLYISRPEDLQKLTEFARGKGFLVSKAELVEAIANYQERYPTGTIDPLRAYVEDFKKFASREELAQLEAPADTTETGEDDA